MSTHSPVPRFEAAGLDLARGQGVGGRGGREQVERLAREAAAARLLARVRRIEDGDRGAVPGETPGEERARGSRAHHGDLHAPAPAAARTSAGEAEAVPSLPTTTPAA